MNKNQRKRQLNRGLAVALAILLAATVTITIIAFSSSKKTKPGKDGTSSTSQMPVTTTTPKQTEPPQTTEKPGDNPVVAKPDKMLIPVAGGTMLKDYSSDVPVWSLTMEDYRIHGGIDIEAAVGTAVTASADGTVTLIEADPMMGQTVEITHSEGCKTVYKNLSTKIPEGLAPGAKVRTGDTIGYVGDTSLIEISEDPHLHFEVWVDGATVNPLSFFEVAKKDPSTDFEDK